VTLINLPFLLLGVKVGLYLGVKNMESPDRKKIFEEWQKGSINVIVATEAFGLGVDLTIRRVISFGLPLNIRTLWQRLGRAGRDGNPSTGVIYWNWKDVQDLNWITKGKSVDQVEKVSQDYSKVLK